MKKTYQMFFALVAMLLCGATNVSAEEISLQEVPFWQHEGDLWGLDAPKNTQATPAWVVGESTGQPYGDGSVNNWADLSGFDQLVITYTEGTPRVMMNRDQNNGQFDATESNSHLIEYPKCSGSWAGKYFTDKDGVLTVDLKAIVNDKGFAHLNAIKGADWQNVTVESMILVRKGKEKQVGWINILNNSDFEGDDVGSFPIVLGGDDNDGGGTYDAEIMDGVGVSGSRGLAIQSMADAPQTWSTQLFVKLPEVLPAGTKWRFSMDVLSSPDANITVAGHAAPRAWLCGGSDISQDFANGFTSTSTWTTFNAEGTISETLAEKGFQSIAFDLNNDKTTATQYYFDNIKFEIYKYGTTAEFQEDNIRVDFGFETNIPELCNATGKSRVMFPVENAQVLINNQDVEITSVEGFADGRFYIFLEDVANEGDEVRVIYNNAAGDLQLKYAGGPNAGQVIGKVDEIADYNGELTNEYEDVYPYIMLAPTVVAAVPEQGSFNIKNDLKEFSVKFDKLADASKIVAKLDGKALTVRPNEGLAEEITLIYSGDNLTDGLHTINISKIYPEFILSDEIYTDTTYQFSVGAPDPNDVSVELIPLSYFNNCANGSIPEGFRLFADNMEERIAGGNYSGGGSRLFNDFAAGGDFTCALYMRTNYLTYGFNDDEHKLTMEAGKPYTLTFNAARWKSSGEFLKVLILDAAGSELLSQIVTCNPDVNGSKNAVKGSSAYSIEFTPEVAGDYELRFVVAKNADGEDAGEEWHELLLANVKFGYISSSFGVAETMALNEALEKAQKTAADNADERYDGDAQAALNDAIAKVEAEKDSYTSPSECTGAVELLNNCSAALISHATLCKDYDELIQKAIIVVRDNANNRFANHPLYIEVKDLAAKYHGTSEWVNVSEDPENENMQWVYDFDKLTDDAVLASAITELKDIVTMTSTLFTEGESKVGTTGIAALVDRLRQGAEALKALGVATDDDLMVRINNAVTDDDDLSDEVKGRITKELYGILKDKDNTLFVAPIDPETGEDTEAPTINMTAFVKNPNIYAISPNKGYSAETVPGWDIPEGNGELGNAWAFSYTSDGVAQDVFFTKYHADTRIEQTITDLPAGVYTIDVNAVRWDDAESEECYAYIITNNADGEEVTNKVQLKYYSAYNNAHDNLFENVVITDGKLTLGSKFSSDGQFFFGRVSLKMTSAAEGFDYAKASGEATGVETVKVTDKANNGVIYNLSGQRVNNNFKGLVIKNGQKFVIK